MLKCFMIYLHLLKRKEMIIYAFVLLCYKLLYLYFSILKKIVVNICMFLDNVVPTTGVIKYLIWYERWNGSRNNSPFKDNIVAFFWREYIFLEGSGLQPRYQAQGNYLAAVLGCGLSATHEHCIGCHIS